jgi:hypothetical protein
MADQFPEDLATQLAAKVADAAPEITEQTIQQMPPEQQDLARSAINIGRTLNKNRGA